MCHDTRRPGGDLKQSLHELVDIMSLLAGNCCATRAAHFAIACAKSSSVIPDNLMCTLTVMTAPCNDTNKLTESVPIGISDLILCLRTFSAPTMLYDVCRYFLRFFFVVAEVHSCCLLLSCRHVCQRSQSHCLRFLSRMPYCRSLARSRTAHWLGNYQGLVSLIVCS